MIITIPMKHDAITANIGLKVIVSASFDKTNPIAAYVPSIQYSAMYLNLFVIKSK